MTEADIDRVIQFALQAHDGSVEANILCQAITAAAGAIAEGREAMLDLNETLDRFVERREQSHAAKARDVTPAKEKQ